MLLSRRLSVTRSGRKPTHAGGRPVAGANAGLPAAESPLRCVFEQCFERGAPAGAQRRDAQSPLQRAFVATGQIQQRVNIGDGQMFGTCQDLHDLVAGSDFALFEHAKIKARPVMRHDERRHLRFVHPDTEPVAGDARLRHLEQRASNPIVVADAHLCVGQAIDREILAELTIGEVGAAKLSLPIAVRIDLINKDRAMLAAVPLQIALTIAVDVEPPRHSAAFDRRFPDSRMDSFALPGDVARETDIDREQARHLCLIADRGSVAAKTF